MISRYNFNFNRSNPLFIANDATIDEQNRHGKKGYVKKATSLFERKIYIIINEKQCPLNRGSFIEYLNQQNSAAQLDKGFSLFGWTICGGSSNDKIMEIFKKLKETPAQELSQNSAPTPPLPLNAPLSPAAVEPFKLNAPPATQFARKKPPRGFSERLYYIAGKEEEGARIFKLLSASNDPNEERLLAQQLDACYASPYSEGTLFSDQEILSSESYEEIQILTNKEGEFFTACRSIYNGKIVIQQQAGRGCTAAVQAMLEADLGGAIPLLTLQMRDLHEISALDFEGSAFEMREILWNQNFPDLKKNIALHGPAIVGISNNEKERQYSIGAHVVIVDEVDLENRQVCIRDPYHGWQIKVSFETFLLRGPGNDGIHIHKKAS
jgi:hypothetical protein